MWKGKRYGRSVRDGKVLVAMVKKDGYDVESDDLEMDFHL